MARTKAALRVKRARSERFSRRAPLGFRLDGGRLVEDAAERAVLERVGTMRSAGVSLAGVVSRLNPEGVKLPTAAGCGRRPRVPSTGWTGAKW